MVPDSTYIYKQLQCQWIATTKFAAADDKPIQKSDSNPIWTVDKNRAQIIVSMMTATTENMIRTHQWTVVIWWKYITIKIIIET